ncbi:MAG: PAS domain S-box protein [Cytophagales bacterium]|nr:PAS domain S-box protein [Cytophagales bacterium]
MAKNNGKAADKQQSLQKLFEHSKLLVLDLDASGLVRYVNPYTLQLIGYELDEVLGNNFVDLIFPDEDVDLRKERFRQRMEHGGLSDTLHVRVKDKRGQEYECGFSTIVRHGPQGQIESLTFVGENITEKKELENSLKERNEQLRSLFEQTNDLIQIFGEDGRLIFVNRSWREKLGYSQDEIAQLNLRDIIYTPYLEPTLAALSDMSARTTQANFETVLLSKDRRRIHLLGHLSREQDNTGRQVFKGIWHDITDRVRAENSQKLFYHIANLAMHSTDLATLFARIHQEMLKIIEVKNFYVALLDEEKSALVFPYLQDELITKEQSPLYERKIAKGLVEYAMGREQPLMLHEHEIAQLVSQHLVQIFRRMPKVWLAAPLKLEERTIGIIAIQSYDDTTAYSIKDLELLDFISGQIALAIQRQRHEEKISSQAARIKAIFESSTHLLWSVSQDGTLTTFNQNYARAFRQIYGIDPWLKMNVAAYSARLTSEEMDFWNSQYAEAYGGKQVHFERAFYFQGREAWIDVYLNPIYDNKGKVEEVSALLQDISSKKKSEIALGENAQRFKEIFESFQDIYFRCDTQGRITMISPSVKELIGYDEEDVLGKTSPTTTSTPPKPKICSAN